MYLEKPIGTGGGSGKRSIDPVTEATLAEGAILEMDTSQLGGVDDTTRTTRPTCVPPPYICSTRRRDSSISSRVRMTAG